MNVLQALAKGAKTTERLQREFEIDSLSIVPGTRGAKSFREGIQAEGISARQTPAQFAGAYAARVVTDLTNDGTRMLLWRSNHPNAIAW
jgi:hypothetical protein